MAHHKRGRPKNARAGCLLCKPHKMNGYSRDERAKHSDEKRKKNAERDIKEYSQV